MLWGLTKGKSSVIFFLHIEIGAKKKSITIVGFSSKYLVELATNRNALLKIEPSINTILRSYDLSFFVRQNVSVGGRTGS